MRAGAIRGMRSPSVCFTLRAHVTTKFASYDLVRKIAAGGMAEIFLARQWAEGGFFRDVVILRDAGFPLSEAAGPAASSNHAAGTGASSSFASAPTRAQQQQSMTTTQQSTTPKQMTLSATIELFRSIAVWWAALWREQCPICATKVF